MTKKKVLQQAYINLERDTISEFFKGKYTASTVEDDDVAFFTDLKKINRRSVMFSPDCTQYFDDFIEDAAEKLTVEEEDCRMNLFLN